MQKKRFTFVCNEYGYKNPSLGSEKKLYTLLRSKTTWSIGFQVSIKNFLTVLTALGVKLIFGNTEFKNVSLLFVMSAARINQLLIKKKSCTHSQKPKPLGLLFFMRSYNNFNNFFQGYLFFFVFQRRHLHFFNLGYN